MTTGRAAMSAWGSYGLSLDPFNAQSFDTYEARLARYQVGEAWYANQIYNRLSTYAQRIKEQHSLYRHIRSIRNPVKRTVDIYPALVYPGSIDWKNPTQGAIPLETDSDELQAAIMDVWKASNWGNEKSPFIRNGARLGDSFIKVVDNPTSEKVYLEVMYPGIVRDCDFDARGNIDAIIIEYERYDEPDLSKVGIGYSGVMPLRPSQKPYTYTERITQDRFETYRDGKPEAFIQDEGQPKPSWPNIYGFIPVTHAPHKRLVGRYGVTPYNGIEGKIHELNDLVSHTHDQIRNAVDIIWYFAGVRKAGDIDAGASDAQRESRRDEVTALYGPADSKPYPMIADIDIMGALEAVGKQSAEVTADIPELSMHEARQSMGDASGIAIENMYSDASGLVYEAQGNYDAALIRAHMMAISMGAMGGYKGYEAFDEGSYERGDLAHTIKKRPVFNTGLSKEARLERLAGVENVPDALLVEYLTLAEVNKAEDIAGQIIAERQTRRAELQAQQQAQLAARSGAKGGQDDEEDDSALPGLFDDFRAKRQLPANVQ